MKNKYLLAIIFTGFFISTFYAQVGIGTTTPNGALDISSSTNGVVVPNVALTTRNTAAPVVNPNGGGTPLTGTLIWNTATAGVTPNNVVPGFYYWDGSTWVAIAGDGGKNWTTTGNSGTTAGTNYMGTTDATDFRIKTNATDRWNISNANSGQLQSFSLGTAALPAYSFSPDTSLGMWSPATSTLAFSTAGVERMRMLSDGRIVVNSTTPYTGDQFSVYSTTSAINGYSTGASGYGLYGLATGATSFGVYGSATGATSYGVYGTTSVSGSIGVRAKNTNTTGTGLLVSGNGTSAYTLAGTGSGAALNGDGVGTVSYGNNTTSGWGVLASGNNGSAYTITGGGGGSFSGNQWGVFANATLTGSGATDRAAFIGNFYENNTTQRTVYIGARIGGTNYKILGTGTGSVSTTMPTRDGERILFAPEAPENWFFDIGEVTLVNGRATVALDPIFVDCIADSKPFKVFVQGGEDTLGSIRITRNQNSKTFIVEDLGGPSNGVVQYSVYAIWKQKENLRFPKYVQPFSIQEMKKQVIKEDNDFKK